MGLGAIGRGAWDGYSSARKRWESYNPEPEQRLEIVKNLAAETEAQLSAGERPAWLNLDPKELAEQCIFDLLPQDFQEILVRAVIRRRLPRRLRVVLPIC